MSFIEHTEGVLGGIKKYKRNLALQEHIIQTNIFITDFKTYLVLSKRIFPRPHTYQMNHPSQVGLNCYRKSALPPG